MSTVSSSVSHRVYFEGSWSARDREQVAAAVSTFETDRSDDDLFQSGPSWVCLVYDIGASELFCAHRSHIRDVLTAETARELAQSIRNATP